MSLNLDALKRLYNKRLAMGLDCDDIPTDTDLFAMFSAIKATAADYPADLLAARRAAFQAQIEANDPDASDDTLSGSLDDAGYGSFGPM